MSASLLLTFSILLKRLMIQLLSLLQADVKHVCSCNSVARPNLAHAYELDFSFQKICAKICVSFTHCSSCELRSSCFAAYVNCISLLPSEAAQRKLLPFFDA